MKDIPLLCIKHKFQSVKVYHFGGKVINILYSGKKLSIFLSLSHLFLFIFLKVLKYSAVTVTAWVHRDMLLKNYFEIDSHATKFQFRLFKYCKVIFK